MLTNIKLSSFNSGFHLRTHKMENYPLSEAGKFSKQDTIESKDKQCELVKESFITKRSIPMNNRFDTHRAQKRSSFSKVDAMKDTFRILPSRKLIGRNYRRRRRALP